MRIRWIVGIAALALLAACGQVADPGAPAAPTSLAATGSSGSVDLDWTASTTADVTYRVYRSSSSPVDVTAGNRLATDLTTTAYTDSTVVAGTTYYYVVTAMSASGESTASNEVSVTPSIAAACAPYSTLACADVFVSTATEFSLDWAASEGGVADTGFTMVLPAENYTGPDANADALLASNLNVASGNLVVTTTAGIKAGLANDQANALGVGFDASTSAHTVSTTVVNPSWPTATADFQQAGIWFGLNDDDYVKLVVISDNDTANVRVQLYYEIGGVSNDPADRVESAYFDASASSVELILTLDPVANTVSGSYSLDGAPAVALGSSLTVDASLFNGTATGFGTMSFAGVFATHRLAASPIDVSFANFALAQP